MVNVNRGDVVLCDLNPVIGTEQAGIRPVVILQIQVRVIDKYRIVKAIGHLDDAYMEELAIALGTIGVVPIAKSDRPYWQWRRLRSLMLQ
ncbi:MAG: type II toxin-antitoxin system PemK/MazF family toxin [Hormoscilla sp.]